MRFLLLSFLIGLGCSPACATDQSKRFETYIRARAALGHFNGTVIVARNDKIIFQRGIGFADFEQRSRATPATRYAVASLTKQFTAAAVLQLRDAGRLSLNDSICKWLEPCPAAWRPARIENLLNHTAGVADYEEPRELGSAAYIALVSQPDNLISIVRESAAKPLEFEPGKKWHYSNTGYVLLAKIVTKASGEPYAQYVERHLLIPAGMNQSLMYKPFVMRNLAHGYELRNQSLKQVAEGVTLTNSEALRPAIMGDFSGEHGDAGLISTAGDLVRWIRALHSGLILKRSSVAEMTRAGRAGYGYGVEVAERFKTKLISHTGGLPGFASRLDWYPEKGLMVAVLSNVGGVRFSAVASDLAAIALGEPYAIPVRHHLMDQPEDVLRRWVGDYRMSDGISSVTVDPKGLLMYKSPAGMTALLMPESSKIFYVPLIEGRLEFEAGVDAAADRLTLRYGGRTLLGRRQN